MRRGLALLGVVASCVACGARTSLYVDLDAGDDVAPPRDAPALIDAATADLGVDAPDVSLPPDLPAIDAPTVDAPPVDVPLIDVPIDRPTADIPPLPVCGDGRRDPGEECDLGPGNDDVWAFTSQQVGRPAVPLAPLARGASAVTFYDYRSASAHTGFEAVNLAQLILHAAPASEALALVFIAGRDASDGATPVQPNSDVRVTFTGVPEGARLAVSDDADEFTRRPDGSFFGRWSFHQNSDGGAFDLLPWDRPWRVVVEPTWLAGVSAFRVVHAGGATVPLVLRDAVAIEHRVTPAACRRDCTVPRCGDGRLDAGEHCDDGNTRDGDACSADCRDLR